MRLPEATIAVERPREKIRFGADRVDRLRRCPAAARRSVGTRRPRRSAREEPEQVLGDAVALGHEQAVVRAAVLDEPCGHSGDAPRFLNSLRGKHRAAVGLRRDRKRVQRRRESRRWGATYPGPNASMRHRHLMAADTATQWFCQTTVTRHEVRWAATSTCWPGGASGAIFAGRQDTTRRRPRESSEWTSQPAAHDAD